jgi:hypothetical protein
MNNYELFKRDPRTANLANDGQARLVSEQETDKAMEMLRYELEHFVCEGQYAKGIQRIIDSFLGNLSSNSQRASWVSGFYGSGKSHLLKMLSHLWTNTVFPDGSTARNLAPDLTPDILASLRELDTAGKQAGGGLFSVSGTMPEGSSDSARLTVLGILFRACGFPSAYHQARFCLYLKDKGFYDAVRDSVTAAGKDFHRELSDLYVSPPIRKALLEADPGLGDEREVRSLLREQFPSVTDLGTPEFINVTKEVLTLQGGGKIPLTAIILDEVQHYVGDNKDRSRHVTELVEALNKQMDSKVLVVAAGQNALSTDTPQFAWLRDRFTIPVELSDADVETVTRKVLLAKKPEAVTLLKDELNKHSGEIERHLTDSRIGPNTKDQDYLVTDYPILPTRRRFWELALRSVDPTGSSSLLRTQLRITHEALRAVAEEPLAHTVPGDFMFFQQQTPLVQQGVLSREISDRLIQLNDGTDKGKLFPRICGLVFLIRKLSREPAVDSGIRANETMLGDLLVDDLKLGGTKLRKELPALLSELVDRGVLLFDGEEYNLQTRESAEWDDKFRLEQASIRQDTSTISHERKARMKSAVDQTLRSIRIRQGLSQTPRETSIHFGIDRPDAPVSAIPLWVRDGWETDEAKVVNTARTEGDTSPMLFIFLPKRKEESLEKNIISMKAARAVLDQKGVPTTHAAEEAKQVMETRFRDAERAVNQIISETIADAKVFKGGGSELNALELVDKIEDGISDALARLFPHFDQADHKSWSVAIDRARKGDDTPLKVVNHTGDTADHRVCREIMNHLGAGMEGRHIRAHFKASPYGWPQDAIDAALISLHAAGCIIATDTKTNETIAPRHLAQTTVPRVKFRSESVAIAPRERVVIKGLIQSLGISVKPSDNENAKALEFISAMQALARKAGGEAPLPPAPDSTHLETIKSESGNQQLKSLFDQHSALKAQAEEWKAQADLAEKRLPLWQQLNDLLSCAPAELPGLAELRTSTDSIKESRLLLEATNHCQPLIKKASDLLRKAFTTARDDYSQERDSQLARLEAADPWQKLTPEQKESVLAKHPVPELQATAIGTDAELLTAIRQSPLPHWKDRTAALKSRIDSLLQEAALLLVPKARPVTLPSATITNTAELDAWLASARALIEDELKSNPVTL